MSAQPKQDQFHQAYDTVLRDARATWCLCESELPTMPRTGTLQIVYAAPEDAENAGTQFALIKRDYGPIQDRSNLPHEAVWLTRAIGDFMNVVIWYDGTSIACFGLKSDCDQAHALYRACCAAADEALAAYWADYRGIYAGVGLQNVRRDFMIGFMKGMTAELYAVAGVRFVEACRSHPGARDFIDQLALEIHGEFEAFCAHIGLNLAHRSLRPSTGRRGRSLGAGDDERPRPMCAG